MDAMDAMDAMSKLVGVWSQLCSRVVEGFFGRIPLFNPNMLKITD